MKPPEEQPVLLRTIVGSQAHQMAREDSDTDYREVFIIPTAEMLSLGRGRLKFAWQAESRHTDDEGGYEIAEWLHLVSKGAPNAVELCFAPIDPDWMPLVDVEHTQVQEVGISLLARGPVQSGVIGYAMNSFRKIPERPGKWKAGMLRVLYQGRELIQTGRTSLVVPPDGWGEFVRMAAANGMSDGEALDLAQGIVEDIELGPSVLPDRPNFELANGWLLDLRRAFWEA